jgi:hypothetical protein
VSGHGMVLDPISRGSRWRFNSSAIRDYDDNGANCGGKDVQYSKYDGKCGICGDSYGDPRPRAHENGGILGDGLIVGEYKMGSEINIILLITSNHLGYFVFDICNLDNDPLETDDCFQELKQLNDSERLLSTLRKDGYFNLALKLPDNLTCDHCVLRWTYVGGNYWNLCKNGKYGLGCGPQEIFKTCSDISIKKDAKEQDKAELHRKFEKFNSSGLLYNTAHAGHHHDKPGTNFIDIKDFRSTSRLNELP